MKSLSFIIITYNRADDLLALLQNIRTLDRAAELLLEVVIVNNASTASYEKVHSFLEEHRDFPFSYFESPVNLGVAKGRNFALTKATAPILIMLDDDAEMQNKDCLIKIVDAFKNYYSKEVAIVSFKVLYFDTLQMQQNALPHKKFNVYKDKSGFETYYYAGGAHAIKRSVLEAVGNYPEDFFYGMEEYDLSYRILNAGYCILYDASIIMLHKESPLGRKPKEEKIRMMWVNKSKVAYKYLPKKYFYSTAFLWSMQFLKETGFNFTGFIKGWKAIRDIPKTTLREMVKEDTIQYIRKLEGRLWY